jgi:cathepsin B
MKVLAVLLILGVVRFGRGDSFVDLDEIVEYINKADTTWKAESPSRFGSLEDVKTVCGTWTVGHPKYNPPKLERAELDINPLKDIPSDFDSRIKWNNCKNTISTVRDQSACGSCWAFASTEAFEDRRCIATGKDVRFSTQDTAGCCRSFACGFSMGCNGGQPSSALDWMSRTGVVTGGNWFERNNATGGCKPYLLQPCAHHVPASSKYPACPSEEYSVQCTSKCSDDAAGKTYADDKTKGAKAVSFSSVEGMQSAIMTNGPLAVAFTVYSDFPTYKSGVYQHTSGSALGGHAVEMIGWGVEDGTPYWLIKNSWNEQWGDGGYFKIRRGNDECGIEDDVTGIVFA